MYEVIFSDVFQDFDLGKRVPVRMLKDSSTCEAANIMVNNLRGAFDAFDRGYLKQIQVVIRDGEQEDARVLETYTFHLGASDDGQFVRALLKDKAQEFRLDAGFKMDQATRTDGMAMLRKATRVFVR